MSVPEEKGKRSDGKEQLIVGRIRQFFFRNSGLCFVCYDTEFIHESQNLVMAEGSGFLHGFHGRNLLCESFQLVVAFGQGLIGSGKRFHESQFFLCFDGGQERFFVQNALGNLSCEAGYSRQEVFAEHFLHGLGLQLDGLYIVFQKNLITGMDFFYMLPDDIECEIEQSCSLKQWQ